MVFNKANWKSQKLFSSFEKWRLQLKAYPLMLRHFSRGVSWSQESTIVLSGDEHRSLWRGVS